MTEPPFSRVGVVGLGLIGGSIALRARLTWPRVTVVGVDRPREMAEAVRRGAIQAASESLASLASCDLVVLAVPVPAILEMMPELARLEPRGVITDVGSIKRQVMAAAAAVGLSSFVGGHPMSGSERVGLEHARPDLFDGRPWLLVAGGAGPAECGRVEQFARGLGALPMWTDAVTHDRTVAYVSHLPQLMSVALMNATAAAVGAGGLGAAGRAFVEMTRLSASPPGLWQDILAANVDFVEEAVARFVASLPAPKDLADRAWVRDAFALAERSRRRPGDDGQRKT